MTFHSSIPPQPPAMPASAYVDVEHAVMTDDGLLLITRLLGSAIDWHQLAIIDPDMDELVAIAVHALDHNVDGDAYRTNATISGQPYIYDPTTRSGFVARENDDPMTWEAAVQVFPPSGGV